MHLNINPLTGKPVNNKRRLVFNEQTMSYISLAKGEELIRDPLNPRKLSIKARGQKFLFDPLQGKYLVAGHKLVFDPLKGKYISLQKGEKLHFDPLRCEFLVVRKKRSS